MALVADIDNVDDSERQEPTLMTLHSAKRLEFQGVVGMEDRLFQNDVHYVW